MEVLLLKTVRLCARFSALMLGALSFAGVSTQAHAQQLLSQPPEVSSSTDSDLPDAPESISRDKGASQTVKAKTVNVSEFSVGVGVTAQLTATRTAHQLNSQNIVGTTPSAGFLATFQQQMRPLVGYDINFGYTRLTENYERNQGTTDPSTGVTSGVFTRGSIPSNVFEISSAYTVKRQQNGSRFQPFAEAGGGVLIFSPTAAPFEGHASYRAAFLFGGGVDYRLNANWRLRAEYRGLFFKNPDFAAVLTQIPVSKPFTVTSEPTISLQYHFGKHGGMQ
jgi:opacity protein-like surface antigen